MLNIPLPRLLPTAIAAMVTLLVLKCGGLVQGAITHADRPRDVTVMVSSAVGAEHLQEPPKPVAASAAPTASSAGQKPASAQKAVTQGASAAAGQATPASAPAAAADATDAALAPPPVSDSEKALLQELRQRRKELDARAAAVSTRESVLAAAEQKLGARVGELQSLQKRLEVLDAAQKQKEDAGWQGMVKLYEAMKPKDAATIFNELSMPVLLQVLDRMKDAKAAAIMAAMTPDKARDVTAELAQLRTGRDSSAAATSKPNPAGG